MKILKKLACVLAVSVVTTSSLSCVYAKEHDQKISEVIKGFSATNGFGVSLKATTSSDIYYAPTISDIRQMNIDSKLCIVIHVETSTGINDVRINGKQATQRTGSYLSGDYFIEAEGSKDYRFWVRDNKGQERETSQYVTITDTSKPSVSLSKTYKNGYCYLVIQASDNGTISSVKIDGSTVNFNQSNGKEEYRIYNSKEYTVEVKDSAGNTTTEKIDININDDKPSLTLDKVFKDNKWYITIKAYPGSGARISKVTVNNSSISFSSSGEVKEYQVNSTGNYNVVVTDNYNQQTSQTIYIDYAVNSESVKPTLTAVAKDMGGIMGIGISVYPSTHLANNGIKQVTVNGTPVSIPNAGGKTDYMVTVSGNYTVVATDAYGNSSTQTVAVTVPTIQATSSQNTNTAIGSSKAVFKINQKSYTLNGVAQSMQDGAPTLKNGRTMLPIRYVAYALNIEPKSIVWDGSSKTVTIYDGSNIIKAPLNSKTITVNGVDQTMEVPATMINGRVYIPISQIAKAFSGVSINWNSSTKEATIIRN